MKKGYNIILFGGPEDNERAKQITGESVFNYCGKPSPLETAEMMKYCKIVVSNDTGPMHLAYAVGTQLIAIFSSRDYTGKWFPPSNETNVVFRNNDIFCGNCFSEERNNDFCMKEIKPERLLANISILIY